MALPSGRTDALEAALFERNALGRVVARISRARIQSAAAVLAGVAGTAQTGEVAESGLVLAHGSLVARVVLTAGFFLLTLQAGIAWRTGADVALVHVFASSAVVARFGGAVVDVHFTEASGESGGAVAVGHVSLGQTQSAVLAESFLADDGQTLVAALGTGRLGDGCSRTLDARRLTFQRLVEVQRARRTRSQSGGRVRSRSAFGLTGFDGRSGRLVRERIRRTR